MKVITNHHRNMALLVLQGSKWLHILRITAHGLEAERITEDELTADWAEMVYPLDKACARFHALAEQHGATETARKLLARACAELETPEDDESWIEELIA